MRSTRVISLATAVALVLATLGAIFAFSPAAAAQAQCHPSYTGACVPLTGPVNCDDVMFQVNVVGPDVYGLDGNDNDNLGCESYPVASGGVVVTTTNSTGVTVISSTVNTATTTTTTAATTTTTAAAATTPVTVSSGANYGFTNGIPMQPAALATTGITNGVPIGTALSLVGIGLLLMSAVWRKQLQQN